MPKKPIKYKVINTKYKVVPVNVLANITEKIPAIPHPERVIAWIVETDD